MKSEDAGRQTILVKDAKIDKSKEKEVWDRCYEGLYLKLGEYVNVKHAHSAALERMQKYPTFNLYHGWARVRDLVVEAINSGTALNVLDDPKAPGGAVHSPFDGQIHINENLYEKYIARADVNWDGFWIILHEFLHSQGYRDAVNYGSKEVPLQEWQTIPIGDANGEGIQEVRMLWTMPGAVEAELNLIRMLFGLPLRYGYADNNFLRFSKLSARRGEDFTYDVTGKSKGPAYYEYYGAALDSSLSNKLMTEEEGRQGNKDRAQTAENLALRAFMVSRTFTGELGGRKASVRFEGGSDNAAVMVVEYMGRAEPGKATEGVRLVCIFQYNADRRERIVLIVGPWDGWPIILFKQQGKEDRFVGSFGGKPSWFAARAAANDARAAPPRRR